MKWILLPIPAGKPWNGATLYAQGGLGGSESAVAQLALALARAGEQVTVMSHGAPVPSTKFEGVEYRLTSDENLNEAIREPWDVVLSSRWLEALVPQWQAPVKLFWTHDIPNTPETTIHADKAVCLSKFHQTAWHLDDSNSVVIGDGVDLSLFKWMSHQPRNENKLVWISNPDRGLALAARIFQEVRKRWPELELHVYGRSAVYGWDANVEAPFLPQARYMENVFLHEPLSKPSLAVELFTTWALFYPTYWPETYCMAALEAQAAGTPVISVPFGALPETVKGGILTYDFLNAISQLRNKGRWSKLSEAGREWAEQNTWAHRAQEFVDLARTVKDAKH